MSLSPQPDPSSEELDADIAQMSYEHARDELVRTVHLLESGQAPLEDALRLWERGEALASHCQAWLDQARARLAAASAPAPEDAPYPAS